MNMMIQSTEALKQHLAHAERRARMAEASMKISAAGKLQEKITLLEAQLSAAKDTINDLAKQLEAERSSNLQLLETELRQSDELHKNAKIPARQIVERVLENFPEITIKDVVSARRERRLCSARALCIQAVYDQRPDLSSPQIGKIFNRDHTTVLHLVGRRSKRGPKWISSTI